MVVARTPDGEMGVLPGHTPVLGVLVGGEVRINATAAESVAAQVDGGFISVDHDRVTLVAERVTIGQAATARSSAP
jgi:F-type H+-transporting ATPase subunit epsilon